MTARSCDDDFFYALVLFQARVVAFVAAAKTTEERTHRAAALMTALKNLSCEDYPQFTQSQARLMETRGEFGCPDGYVLCHGVCMQSCYDEIYTVNPLG